MSHVPPHYRLNKLGQSEQVRARKGRRPAGTLSELDALLDEVWSLLETVEFTVPSAVSAEQPGWQRNQDTGPQVASRGDPARATGDTLTNMTVAPQTSELGLGLGPTPALAPDLAKVKTKLPAQPDGNPLRGKYITGYNGDSLDYGATHSESVTGTGAIAIMPAALGSPSRRRRKPKDTTTTLEYEMSTRRTITEWLPGFKGNGYNPGDYQMPSPGGKGVAERTPTSDSVGSYDTDTSNAGKEWPRDHNDTAAMCDVDDDGVEHEPQGSHESTHGEPTDGHQKKVGHNWPDQPTNSGQGVAEPFAGSRWSDGGVLTGRGPGSDTWTHEEGPGMPSDGEITGTSGPQLGQPSNEGWSPDNMARLMGGDFNVQMLFDNYARTVPAVCVEDFQNLCDAHGAQVVLDRASLLNLMDQNNEFMFYEGSDHDGPYWTPESLTECDDMCSKCKKAPCKCRKMTGESVGDEHRRPFAGKKVLTELQIRTPEEEANLFTHDRGPGLDASHYTGDPHMGAGTGAGFEHDDYNTRLGGGATAEMPMECPGCGYTGLEAECPECGIEMMDAEEEFADPRAMKSGMGGGMKSGMGGGLGGLSPMESRTTIVTGPDTMTSLKRFMTSAGALLEQHPNARKRDMAEALNHSWEFYAGNIDPRTCPTKVQQTLQGMMTKYPGFNPLLENSAMTPPDGTKLGGGDGPKDNLPKQPAEFKTHGDKSLLGKSQVNNLDGTPTVAGTGKGMTGKSVSEAAAAVMQNNVTRLGHHVKKSIQEHAKSLIGKFTLNFNVLVQEAKKLPPEFQANIKKKKDGKKPPTDKKSPAGKKPPVVKNSTKTRDNLAEALADAEEILQLHSPEDVTFVATYLGPNGQIVMKQDIPLFTIGGRGPVVGEGKALFRFQRNAEAFAAQLVAEGVTCRVLPHNWGSAVEARTTYECATKAFRTLAEGLLSEKDWIKKAFKSVKTRGTEGVCTGEKYGSDSCPPGSKRYNMAKNLRKMAHG